MVRKSIWLIALVAAMAAPAYAQENLEKGKTGSEIFASDCSGCHNTPQGLARKLSGTALVGFLREHYTTEPAMARELANYLSGLPSAHTPERRKETHTPANRKRATRTQTEPKPGDTPDAKQAEKKEPNPAGHKKTKATKREPAPASTEAKPDAQKADAHKKKTTTRAKPKPDGKTKPASTAAATTADKPGAQRVFSAPTP